MSGERISQVYGNCHLCPRKLMSTDAGQCCACDEPDKRGMHDICGENSSQSLRCNVVVNCKRCNVRLEHKYVGWFGYDSVVAAWAQKICSSVRWFVTRVALALFVGLTIIYIAKIFFGLRLYFTWSGDTELSFLEAFSKQLLKSHHYNGWNPLKWWPVALALAGMVSGVIIAIEFSTLGLLEAATWPRRIWAWLYPKQTSARIVKPTTSSPAATTARAAVVGA